MRRDILQWAEMLRCVSGYIDASLGMIDASKCKWLQVDASSSAKRPGLLDGVAPVEVIKSQSAFDRDGILRALWADPVAQLAFGAAPVRLMRGDEYLDLQRLAAGVQIAIRGMAPTGGELSRNAVAPLTWAKLLGYL